MKLLKAALFYVLFYLRGLFMLAGRLLGGLLLLLCIVSLFIKSYPWYASVVLGVLGFATFLLRQFYDQLLLKLNPTGNDLTLYQ